jgi:hypothetical protein
MRPPSKKGRNGNRNRNDAQLNLENTNSFSRASSKNGHNKDSIERNQKVSSKNKQDSYQCNE